MDGFVVEIGYEEIEGNIEADGDWDAKDGLDVNSSDRQVGK